MIRHCIHTCISHIYLISLSLSVSLPMYIDNMFLHSCMSSWSLLDAFVWLAVIWHIFFTFRLKSCPQATPTIFLRHFTNCVFADCSDWKCEIENAIASRNSADQTFFWKTWPWKQASLAVLPKNPGGVWDDCCLDLGRVHQGFVNPHVLHSGRKSWEHWQLQTLVVHPATGQDSKFSAGHPQGGWHSFQTFYQPLQLESL